MSGTAIISRFYTKVVCLKTTVFMALKLLLSHIQLQAKTKIALQNTTLSNNTLATPLAVN